MRQRISIAKEKAPVEKTKTKLVDLEVTKVDFVPAGASQDPNNPAVGAHIKLFKGKDGEPGAEGDVEKLTVLQKIAKLLGINLSEPVAKEAKTFSEEVQAMRARQIFSQLWDYWYALEDSIRSILSDDTVDKKALIMGSVDQFNTTVSQTIETWLNMNPQTVAKATLEIPAEVIERLQKAQTTLGQIITGAEAPKVEPITKNKTETEGLKEMKIDITKVKPEDREFLFKVDFNALDKLSADDKARLEKIKTEAGEEDVNKSKPNPAPAAPITTLPEEVLKNLDPVVKSTIESIMGTAADAVQKAAAAQEVVKQMQEANKVNEYITKARAEYGNIPGIDPAVVGPVMKSLADNNPTALTALETVLKAADAAIKGSSLFKEFGGSRQVATGSAWDKVQKAAEDIRKANPALSMAQAIAKVGDINPQLIAEYEVESEAE